MSRRASNVVALPSKPIARAVGAGGAAAILELGGVDRLIKQVAAASVRELELQSAFDQARRERKALIQRLGRLPE
jgi:hypothetical protein